MATSSGAVAKRQLGMALRHWRRERSLDREAVAEVLECSASKITKIENGDVSVRPDDLHRLLELYRITGSERADAEELAAQSRGRRPRTSWGPAVPDWFRRYAHLEDGAIRIRDIGYVVTGLLQTEDTVRALISASPLPHPADVENLVQARLARQRRVLGENKTHVHSIMRECVLAPVIGGHDVHRAQLRHLRELADQDEITIQIIPNSVGADPAAGLSFTLLELPNVADGLDVVYLEDPTSARYVDRDLREQQRYGLIWSAAERAALSPAASVELLDTLVSRP
jgi:transcriptional regulator with XRE-family HTH domain